MVGCLLASQQHRRRWARRCGRLRPGVLPYTLDTMSGASIQPVKQQKRLHKAVRRFEIYTVRRATRLLHAASVFGKDDSSPSRFMVAESPCRARRHKPYPLAKASSRNHCSLARILSIKQLSKTLFELFASCDSSPLRRLLIAYSIHSWERFMAASRCQYSFTLSTWFHV